MDAVDLYISLHNQLELTAVLVRSDAEINVGDTFTIKFTVRNAPISYGRRRRPEPVPLVVFKNVHLSVRGTDYATLVGHSEQDATSPLKPGEKAVFSIGFRARQTLGGSAGSTTQELVANASVRADLDLDEFFKFKQSLAVRAEIVP